MAIYFAYQNYDHAYTKTTQGDSTFIDFDYSAEPVICLAELKPTNKPGKYKIVSKEHSDYNKQVVVWSNKNFPMKRGNHGYVLDENAVEKHNKQVIRFNGRSGSCIGYVVENMEQAIEGYKNQKLTTVFFHE